MFLWDKEELERRLSPQRRSFRKEEVITRLEEGEKQAGIVKKGLVYLLSTNSEGDSVILDYYREGDVFGGRLIPFPTVNLYYIGAGKATDVYFLSWNELKTHFGENRTDRLLQAGVNRSLLHADILAQRTIRKKLMTYFRAQAIEEEAQTFELPLSLTALAEYIAVDRSAMMRELRKMSNEHIITVQKGSITIL